MHAVLSSLFLAGDSGIGHAFDGLGFVADQHRDAAQVAVNALGGQLAGAHGEDHRGAAGDDVAAGPDAVGDLAVLVGLEPADVALERFDLAPVGLLGDRGDDRVELVAQVAATDFSPLEISRATAPYHAILAVSLALALVFFVLFEFISWLVFPHHETYFDRLVHDSDK